MNSLIGFLIAAAVGLTGIGGGSFTVPALLLVAGLTAGEAVGTAFLFAGVLRLIAALSIWSGSRFIRVIFGFCCKEQFQAFCRHLGAPFLESRCWEFSCNPGAWSAPRGVIQRGFHKASAESHLRREKPSLASVARSADWRGIGIFIRWCGGAGNSSSPQLFRDDTGASCGNRLVVWIGLGSHRQRVSLELWFDQHADPFSATSRWRSWGGSWVPAGAKSSCK